MKLLLSCMQCQIDDGDPSLEFHRVEISNDGVHSVTCSAGHQTYTVLNAQKCEILFEIGANAMIDGYYREAVSSFASALERFYEFCIRVMAQNTDFDSSKFSTCWKIVSNQSERQLGAFTFLWFYHFGDAPNTLSNSQTRFRNSVIHKGKIPNRAEAFKYGNAVLNVVKDCIQKMHSEDYEKQIRNVLSDQLREQHKNVDAKHRVSSLSILTILSINRPGYTEHMSKSLENHIEDLASRRESLKSYDPYVK